MAPKGFDASDYFAAPANSFWQWQDQGNVIAWADGATIAFRYELRTILERLRTQSLPPLGALALLLAACRENWNEPTSRQGLLQAMLTNNKRPDRIEFLARVMHRLDRVSELSGELRHESRAKAELAATVFEGQGNAPSPQTYERLLEALADGLDERYCTPWPKLSAIDVLLRDLAWLDRGLDRVDEQALRLRLRTGLDQSLLPVEIELPSPGSARSLIADLLDDAELGPVARLAQLLLAAVHLPTPFSQPEELPLGGVTDISNRGSLDRLLLSELAHDGLTLAVRVAMNEALYLRRETPPHVPTRRRLILLDAGLRMWGVPRVFATAVGLALAAGANPRVDVRVFRAEGANLIPVDMTTASGLTEHLAALDHRAHPGAAFAALAEELDAAAADDEATDVVLVTADDVLADRAFQRALAEARFPELHLASVNRQGRFQLQLQTPRGRKPLREAQLSLDDVLRPRAPPSVKLLADSAALLPAIFRAEPFPLRLSAQPDLKRSWQIRGLGVLTFTRDGRLLHWNEAKHGARQLADGLPEGTLHWAQSSSRAGKVRAVIGKLSGNGLYALSYDFESDFCVTIRLNSSVQQPREAFMLPSAVFVVDDHEVAAVDPETGRVLAAVRLNGMTRHRGRFFKKWDDGRWHWHAIAFNGREIVWESLYNEKSRQTELIAVFDAVRKESPIGITSEGNLISLGSEITAAVNLDAAPGSVRVAGIGRDGSKILFDFNNLLTHKRMLVDVHTLAAAPESLSVEPLAILEREIWKCARPVDLHRRFHGIGLNSNGDLTLLGRRDKLWPLSLCDHRNALLLATTPANVNLGISRRFELIDNSAENRYLLSAAVFADGSRAVLDARGLLHLKSSDPSLPECTIVLVQGETSGWVSDGRLWGTKYFIGEQPATNAKEIYEQVIRPFTERLR